MHFIQSKKKFFIFDLQDNLLAILADSVTENPIKRLNEQTARAAPIKFLDIPDNTPRNSLAKRHGLPCTCDQINSLRRSNSKTKIGKQWAYDFW